MNYIHMDNTYILSKSKVYKEGRRNKAQYLWYRDLQEEETRPHKNPTNPTNLSKKGKGAR